MRVVAPEATLKTGKQLNAKSNVIHANFGRKAEVLQAA